MVSLAVRQLHNKIMRQSSPGGSFHLLLRDGRLPVSNVVTQSVVEKHRLLRDHAICERSEGSVVIANVASIDEQTPAVTSKKRGSSAPACSCRSARPYYGHDFSGEHFEIDVAENFPRLVAIRLVGEAHTFRRMFFEKGGMGLTPGFSLTSSSVSINLKIPRRARACWNC